MASQKTSMAWETAGEQGVQGSVQGWGRLRGLWDGACPANNSDDTEKTLLYYLGDLYVTPRSG